MRISFEYLKTFEGLCYKRFSYTQINLLCDFDKR